MTKATTLVIGKSAPLGAGFFLVFDGISARSSHGSEITVPRLVGGGGGGRALR